jgi:hypothetical protein
MRERWVLLAHPPFCTKELSGEFFVWYLAAKKRAGAHVGHGAGHVLALEQQDSVVSQSRSTNLTKFFFDPFETGSFLEC